MLAQESTQDSHSHDLGLLDADSPLVGILVVGLATSHLIHIDQNSDLFALTKSVERPADLVTIPQVLWNLLAKSFLDGWRFEDGHDQTTLLNSRWTIGSADCHIVLVDILVRERGDLELIDSNGDRPAKVNTVSWGTRS